VRPLVFLYIYTLRPHRHRKSRFTPYTRIAVKRTRVCTLSGNLNNGRMSAWRAESVFYIRMAQLEIFRRRG